MCGEFKSAFISGNMLSSASSGLEFCRAAMVDVTLRGRRVELQN